MKNSFSHFTERTVVGNYRVHDRNKPLRCYDTMQHLPLQIPNPLGSRRLCTVPSTPGSEGERERIRLVLCRRLNLFSGGFACVPLILSVRGGALTTQGFLRVLPDNRSGHRRALCFCCRENAWQRQKALYVWMREVKTAGCVRVEGGGRESRASERRTWRSHSWSPTADAAEETKPGSWCLSLSVFSSPPGKFLIRWDGQQGRRGDEAVCPAERKKEEPEGSMK